MTERLLKQCHRFFFLFLELFLRFVLKKIMKLFYCRSLMAMLWFFLYFELSVKCFKRN